MKLQLRLYLITTTTVSTYAMVNDLAIPLIKNRVQNAHKIELVEPAITEENLNIKFLYVPMNQSDPYISLMSIFITKKIKGEEKLLLTGLLKGLGSPNVMRFTCLLCHLPFIRQLDFHKHVDECIEKQIS